MLDRNPDARMTAEDALKHPFITAPKLVDEDRIYAWNLVRPNKMTARKDVLEKLALVVLAGPTQPTSTVFHHAALQGRMTYMGLDQMPAPAILKGIWPGANHNGELTTQ